MPKKITKRALASEKIKNKILTVAGEMFDRYGYRATTTCQIIEKAGITTGTLYHFFRDKEDILLHRTKIVYDEAMKAADIIATEIAGEKDDSALRYAIIYALEMKAVERYDRVAEHYMESYSSPRITEVMLPMNIERNRAFFQKYNPDMTDEECYIKTLALRGMRLAFLAERVYKRKVDYEAKCSFLIETSLAIFNVPANKISSIVSKALALTKEDRFVVQKFKV